MENGGPMKEERNGGEKGSKAKGATRRMFLFNMAAGVAVAAAPGRIAASKSRTSDLLKANKMVQITLLPNSRHHRILVEPRWSLLYMLREKLGLGACTALMDDIPRYACLTLAVEAPGRPNYNH